MSQFAVAEASIARVAWRRGSITRRRTWPAQAPITAQRTRPSSALHAWLVAELPGGCILVLIEEKRTGQPAHGLTAARLNPC